MTVEELREEGALPKAEEDLKPIDELIVSHTHARARSSFFIFWARP